MSGISNATKAKRRTLVDSLSLGNLEAPQLVVPAW
jgi:hypothetical protein